MPLINLNGIDLHYHCDDFSSPWQNTTPVILIHSAGGNIHRWTQWMPNLAKSRPVIRFDLRGHGESSNGTLIESVDQLIDDIKCLLDALNLSEVHVIGASAGGVISIKLAETLSPYVKTMTLVASTPFLAKTDINTQTWGEILRTQGTEAWLKADSDLRFGQNTPQHVIDWYGQEGAKTPSGTVISLQSVLLAQNYANILSSIKTPTLILASRVDGITPPAAQETLNNNLPNSNLMWFENVGHNMKLEIPDQLSNVCVNFMNNNDAN